MAGVSNQGSHAVDVIIVGAGITGQAAAGLLAREGLQVALIDAQETAKTGQDAPPDPRALAITPASRQILDAVGAWSKMDPRRIGHFRRMDVWDENGRGEIHFDSADVCRPTLGYIIESTILTRALTAAIRNESRVSWYQPARPRSLDVEPQQAVVSLDDGRCITARLVIAADGKDSLTRSLAGIGFVRHDYEQAALACIVRTEKAHGDTARQRFLSDGTLAFLPMNDAHECGIVWSILPEQVQALLKLETTVFQRELEATLEMRLGAVTALGPRVHYPLGHGSAERYIGDRLALIGDAAHVVHPLAGQGANLGILDAAALSQVVTETYRRGRDIGDRQVLRRYERWRRGDDQFMMHVMTGFKELFTRQTPPLPQLRNLGLRITDRLPPVKHYLMEYAMGIRGDIPDVARVREALR